MIPDEIRKKNRRLLFALIIFALSLTALIIILMILRGPTKTY